jgi:uncharacterized protein (TIGR02147 family)
MARDLGISSGRLSDVMSGKHGLSRASASRFSERLVFTDEQRAHFTDLVVRDHARSKRDREAARERLTARRRGPRYRRVAIDHFRFIAGWYHLAILELSKLDGFQSDEAWISRALGVPLSRVREALFTLERLGFLRRKKNEWTFETRDTFTSSEVPSQAVRQFHAQILDKAKDAIHEQSVDTRELTATLLALDRARIKEIKARIGAFWRAMDEEFGAGKQANEVYCLSVQCFKVTRGLDEK